jgi:hypothetical protein
VSIVRHLASRSMVDIAKYDRRISMTAEDVTNQWGRVSLGKDARRQLVQQRLKEMVIAAVDDRHLDRLSTQALRGEEAGESAPDDRDGRRTGLVGRLERIGGRQRPPPAAAWLVGRSSRATEEVQQLARAGRSVGRKVLDKPPAWIRLL